ncbi:MAG: cytidine deaminase [Alphaproteobacteria bacterium]
MANIKEATHHVRGKGAEMRLEISEYVNAKKNSQTGKISGKFTFVLKDNHINVDPPIKKGNEKAPDWRRDLTDQEKIAVFSKILARHRGYVHAEGDFKLAAIGVSENGDIYVAQNHEWTSHNYETQCAEMNLIGIGFSRQAYKHDRELNRIQPRDSAIRSNFTPRFEQIYLMGGIDGHIPITCPCGSCTDALAKFMNPEAKISILPLGLEVKETQNIVINSRAEVTSELAKGEVWQTSIGHLNRHREIALPKDQAILQKNGMSHLVERITPKLVARLGSDISASQKIAPLGEMEKRALFTMPLAMNRHMIAAIEETLLDQLAGIALELRKQGNLPEITPQVVQKMIIDHIRCIRCVMIQTDNGQVFNVVTPESSITRAEPPAEVLARGQMGSINGTQGIIRVQAMEFSPRDIAAGILRTSAKQAVQRVVKMKSKRAGDLTFSFLPFNDGNLTLEQAKKFIHLFSESDLLPGEFKGFTRQNGKHVGALNNPLSSQNAAASFRG